MLRFIKSANFICAIVISNIAILLSSSAHASDIEITPYIGQIFSSELVNSVDATEVPVDDASYYGLAIAWQDSPNGQGQILINRASYDFISSSDLQEHSFDVTYAHFSGVAQFRQRNYVTTVSLGLGAAYFQTDNKDEIYPSLTIAIGTRYELSKNFAIVTELRGYASYIEEDNQLFCEGASCHALLEESMWLEGTVSVGLAFKF
ncbi:MAG: hypothetical protein HRT53_03410 [Colwellia sp.]|nr:hypothetical protein [Colwellia sp.]